MVYRFPDTSQPPLVCLDVKDHSSGFLAFGSESIGYFAGNPALAIRACEAALCNDTNFREEDLALDWPQTFARFAGGSEGSS